MPSAEHRPGTCEVIASVRLAGDTNVRAVVDAASRTGRGYIAVRVGRVLLYLEDRVAFDALAGAVRAAGAHADAVYGEPRDAFGLTEARAGPLQRGLLARRRRICHPDDEHEGRGEAIRKARQVNAVTLDFPKVTAHRAK
jgi:hypothetical protein